MPIFNPGGGGGTTTASAITIGPRFAFFGDSISNYDQTYGMYAAWLSGGKIEPIRFASHSGYTSTQLAAVIQSEIIDPGGIDTVVIECGSNDAGGNTALTTFAANVTSMVTAVKAAGLYPILVTVPPRNGKSLYVATYNAWLSRYASSADVMLVDLNATVVDPATGDWLSAMSAGEGIHPNVAGNKVFGQTLANAATPLIPSTPYNVQPFPGAPNLLSNSQFLTGTTTPTGYGAASGTGVTASLVTDTRGFKWRRIVLASAGSRVTYGGFEVDAGAGTFAVGDRMRFSARLRLPADLATVGSTGDGLCMRATCYTAGFASSPLDVYLTGPALGWRALTKQGEGVLTTEFVIPATTALIFVSNTIGPQDGTYDDAQPTLLNLTKLGIPA